MTFKAVKDPDAVLDYRINWEEVLNNNEIPDTITSSSGVVDNGLVLDSNSFTDTTSTAWVSAGTLGQLGRLVNTIVTTGGRTHVRTIEVSVKDT